MSELTTESTPATSSSPPDADASPIGRVLVCLDRSVLAHSALPYARYIAESFGAQLTLLHVLPSPGEGRQDALEWEIAQREANHYLDDARTILGTASTTITTRLAQGTPAREIVAACRDIDLTILSSQGEGGGPAAELGSVAHHVLAVASGSVLLLQPHSTAQIPPRRLLVPLDGSLRAESVLPIVAGLARGHDCTVVLVHVVRDPTAMAVLADPSDVELAEQLAGRVEVNAEGYLARIRARMLSTVGNVETIVMRRPEERQAVLDVAQQQNIDLVVVTAHGSTCNAGCIFGSVSSYLLAQSRLPILVLQDMPRHESSARSQVARASSSSHPPVNY